MSNKSEVVSDRVQICEAEQSDYDAIYEIHSYYIEQTDNNWNHRPKPVEPFMAHLDELRQVGRPVIVARKNNSVVGYGALHEFRNADGYWPCVENSVYVHPDHQGQQIGRRLMTVLIDQAAACGLWAIIAVIDSGNASSIRFHEQCGFKECGRMNLIGEKNHRPLSAVFLQYDLPENRVRFLADNPEET